MRNSPNFIVISVGEFVAVKLIFLFCRILYPHPLGCDPLPAHHTPFGWTRIDLKRREHFHTIPECPMLKSASISPGRRSLGQSDGTAMDPTKEGPPVHA